MQKYKAYIYLLVVSIFIQNSIVLFDIVEDYFGIDTSITVLLEKSEDCKSQEDSEDNEKESKENELKEKEKELKNYYKTIASILNASSAQKHSTNFDVSKIFKQYFETETPPPKYT